MTMLNNRRQQLHNLSQLARTMAPAGYPNVSFMSPNVNPAPSYSHNPFQMFQQQQGGFQQQRHTRFSLRPRPVRQVPSYQFNR